MRTTDPGDAARIELLLAELRLPAVKQIWASLAAQADKEGWPAGRFLAALAEHEIAERSRRRLERHLADLTALAGGYSPIYPCHIKPRDMRQRPIGTGPFKFVEFKPNEVVRVTRNPDYWKKDRPYLDGIEYTIIRNQSTAILAFTAGKFDMTFPYSVTIPLL